MSLRSRNSNVTDSKKNYFRQDYKRGEVLDKKMSHDFVRAQSVAETCFSHWGWPGGIYVGLRSLLDKG